MIRTPNDIQAYQRSKRFFPVIIKITKNFPREAKFLADQIRRSANSVHSNIAEGFGRTEAEFKNYLARALGSNNELLSHLDDARTSGYIKCDTFEALNKVYTITGKQIFRLREKWKRK